MQNRTDVMTTRIIGCVTLLLIATSCFGQDGSDMRYVPIKKINVFFIGEFAHLDFYKNSHWGLKLDTVVINVNNKPIKFIEHRVDDGFNQWFVQQYLQSIDSIEGVTIRIVKCKIDSVTKDSILVTNFLEYYDTNNKLLIEKSRQEKCWFTKNIIDCLLIKSKVFGT